MMYNCMNTHWLLPFFHSNWSKKGIHFMFWNFDVSFPEQCLLRWWMIKQVAIQGNKTVGILFTGQVICRRFWFMVASFLFPNPFIRGKTSETSQDIVYRQWLPWVARHSEFFRCSQLCPSVRSQATASKLHHVLSSSQINFVLSPN